MAVGANGRAWSPCRTSLRASLPSPSRRRASRPTASSPGSGLPIRTSHPRRRRHRAPPFCPDERPELVALDLVHLQVAEHELVELLHLLSSHPEYPQHRVLVNADGICGPSYASAPHERCEYLVQLLVWEPELEERGVPVLGER